MAPAGNDDDFPPDPLFDESEQQPGRESRSGGFVPDFVRRMAVAGMGAVFMTEEGIRSLAGQLKLPKEALGFILSQAEKTKDDISRVVTEELRRFMQSEKLRDEFLKLLSGMTVEVKAQIRLVPSEKEEKQEAPPPPEAPKGKKAAEPPPSARVVITELNARRPASKRTKRE
ncbi:hypothetical protein D7Y13_33995 [Corallococcus praedator]|uniref:Uncharacterized protein n=1 Tax=Corallococcus praedator TaxID=2316724 RepID=A0ABX9QAY1_9BACT|nr:MULTISPECIES: hypothetical protein [Corallococcus]RKH03513.1 hypothetical protein D7X74_36185 [Corallococcus sp. CA047B]RKH21572.1 hypothetical protein D7X75_36770 [Corallococcus sp. CA031C]RKH93902.1 hypothetical protein D7Y13_33995 [Corallococcus praedator]